MDKADYRKLAKLDILGFTDDAGHKFDQIGNANLEINACFKTHLDCKYYTVKDFNVDMRGFSFIHFNSRILYSNFSKTIDYLNKFKEKFTVVTFIETWIKVRKDLLDKLEGYEMFTQDS